MIALYFLLSALIALAAAFARQRHSLYIQHCALEALHRQPVDYAHALAADMRMPAGMRRVVARVHDPLHILALNHMAAVHLRQSRGHLHYVDRVAA